MKRINTWSRTYGKKVKGVWVTTPFNNWKNALEKMKIHSQSDQHKERTSVVRATRIVETLCQNSGLRPSMEGHVPSEMQN